MDGPLPSYKAAPDYMNGIPLGGWIFYPSLIVAGTYNDNIYRSYTNKVSGWGAEIIPSFTAELNDGIHKTTVFGTMDGRFYKDQSQADQIDANAGIRHVYEMLPDLIFRFQGDYMRQADVFTNGLVTSAGQPLVTNNQVNVANGLVSVEKDFDRAFIILGGQVNDTFYDNALQQARNGQIYTGIGRLGFWFTPFLNAFVEGSGDTRRYQSNVLDSSGYRVIGGLATGQIGLFQGQVFGGYQSEKYDNAPAVGVAPIGNNNSPVFGARLSYFPTPYWTIRAIVDETLGVAAVVTPTTPVTAMTVTDARLETDWGLWRFWTVTARAGYDHATYVNSLRVDNAWFAGGRLGYQIWANLGFSLDYQYTRLNSNVVVNNYNQNRVFLGLMYRY